MHNINIKLLDLKLQRVFKCTLKWENHRALCNDQSDNVYPNVEVVFLLEGSYDHSPILILFYQVSNAKPFEIFNLWTNNDNFIKVMQGVWNMQISCCMSFQIQQKLKKLKSALRSKFLHPLFKPPFVRLKRSMKRLRITSIWTLIIIWLLIFNIP